MPKILSAPSLVSRLKAIQFVLDALICNLIHSHPP